jgi:Glycosyl transferase family 2
LRVHGPLALQAEFRGEGAVECRISSMASFAATSQEQSVQAGNAYLFGGRRLKGIVAENSADCPLVSVVTVLFNGRPCVEGCLDSVARQDYPNIEHIVIDGGSTDGTIDILRQYDNQLAFWKSEPDRGVYDAWNKGLREARGEWICFLGADDEFLTGAVSAYMAFAANNPQAEYLSSKVRWVHPSGYERTIGGAWTWDKFSQSMCTAHVGSMHRRNLFDRLGIYDTSYRIVADYELLLRARQHLNAAYMPITTAMMRAGGISDSAAALEETERAKVKAGGRNPLLARMELGMAKVKFALRPLRRTSGTITP